MAPPAALSVACLVVASMVTAACVLIGVAPYPAAAVMAGTGVAAVGVHRAATGDCWGNCIGLSTCERDSGLCVPRPCRGECHYDEICEHDRCVTRSREQAGSSTDFDAGGEFEAIDGTRDN